MVELFESDIRSNERRSSKGNQLKWESNKQWYKADYTGYEGLAEYVVSALLKHSNLREDEYVIYHPEQIKYGSQIYNGVRSEDFLNNDWQIITAERCYKSFFGESLNTVIYRTKSHIERLKRIVEDLERITGLEEIGVYMSKLLTIDALFLNEDRHTHNIAVLTDGMGAYRLCPFFDQGASLLADTTMDYPLVDDVYQLIDKVKPKTFCQDFTEQLDIAEKLYGEHIHFSFTHQDIDNILTGIPEGMYSDSIIDRVRTVLYEQMRKYRYLFS